jgi:hypothetical protein
MNEHIKKIAQDCGLYIAYDNRDVTDKEIEFFAMMIIRDCISICEDIGSELDCHYGADAIARKYKDIL